ncbi:MAG: neutral zinc metallopeptidase [Erythrobacter sp.]|uniref:KPN_02809 family neutral zinc metallopeptidase n=1 Tax=Erythrobacter sp. TaxID=1042 RepID=UPI0026280555|nr:neutral zinc metallopeptidase [Erythrobacter sp.]MDJ0977899.1 neutral zinc metallopeptidase [Erythrobacter sp.]
MRLNPFNTSKIKVGTTGGRGRKAGGVGCFAIVAALIGALVFGIDPSQTLSVLGSMEAGGPVEAPAGMSEEDICSSNAYASETCAALTSLNETWERTFAEQGVPFRQPTLRFKTASQFQTACGVGSKATGPFYCPADETIYIDVGFYDQLARMSGENGDFARLYVVAHEYGHHIQTITGISGQIRSAQNANPRLANQLNVLMELQADCYAGVWAAKNRNRLDSGDMQEGLRAASAIGDDTIQQRSTGRVNPETFTHGSSEQRQKALALGLQGDDRACDRITQMS